MAEYVNERPVCVSCQGSNKQNNNRFPRGLLLSFGLLCVLQATLNVSLRLYLAQQGQLKCPQGWAQFQDSRCFLVETTNRNWTEAEFFCRSMGGNLASVHGSEEYSYIQTLIRAKNNQASVESWVGGYDAIQEGLWFWSDGTQFDFELWAPTGNQPDNRENNEHCLEVNFEEEKLWNDEPCGQQAPSVCAKRLSPIYQDKHLSSLQTTMFSPSVQFENGR